MVNQAKSNEAADHARRELVELKNRAENMSYQMDKLIKENKDKISADSVKAIEEAIKELNTVREGQEKDKIQAALTKLEQASHKAAEEMYKAAGAAGATPGGPPPPGAQPGAAPGSSAQPQE